jgi:hypothetical protein
MANFAIQMNAFDKNLTEDNLKDLELELQEEQQLSETLSDDSASQLQAAKDFVATHKGTIENQHQRLGNLSVALKAIVQSNKEKIAANTELSELIASEEYVELAKKMSEIKAGIDQLRAYLIVEGVRGRPQEPLPF